MKNIYYYETILGKLGIIEENNFITHMFFNEVQNLSDFQIKETLLHKEAITQVQEYLSAKRTEFTLPIRPEGTAFMKKVWFALQTVPYGQTKSYSEIAEIVKSPKACRAVGLASGKNPIIFVIPCHRIIGKNGNLVGFSAGIERKEFLLNMEKSRLNNNLIR